MNSNFKYFEAIRKRIEEDTQVKLAYHYRKFQKKMEDKRRLLIFEKEAREKRERLKITKKNSLMKRKMAKVF